MHFSPGSVSCGVGPGVCRLHRIFGEMKPTILDSGVLVPPLMEDGYSPFKMGICKCSRHHLGDEKAPPIRKWGPEFCWKLETLQETPVRPVWGLIYCRVCNTQSSTEFLGQKDQQVFLVPLLPDSPKVVCSLAPPRPLQSYGLCISLVNLQLPEHKGKEDG